MLVSVVIPVLNDAVPLRALLEQLRLLCFFEIVVADGGSSDLSRRSALDYGATLVDSKPGRARQMAAGVEAATGDWIWFLHADATVSADNVAEFDAMPAHFKWGRFDVVFDETPMMMAVVQSSMNVRSRLTQICTGDQGIFARRDVLESIGGVPQQALMEDIELTKRLRRIGQSYRPESRLGASARRWRKDGVGSTILLMWKLRARYFFGAHPEDLAEQYHR